MSGALFTINFRRETFEREIARSRRRIVHLSAWLAYFGIVGLVLYIYGLNYVALERRTQQVERQIEMFSQSGNLPRRISLDPTQTAAIERFHMSPRRWRDRLSRLAELIPDNAILSSVAVNPGNSNQAADQNKLVIAGRLKAASEEDPTRGVVQLIASLQSDSAFAAGYQSIKLSHSTVGSAAGTTEFVIECR